MYSCEMWLFVVSEQKEKKHRFSILPFVGCMEISVFNEKTKDDKYKIRN